jgi:Glycosyltransferase family 87
MLPLIKPWLRQLLAILLLGVSLFWLYRVSPQLVSKKMVNYDDFVVYWSAGRLNLRGIAPYDLKQLLPLQLQVGRRYHVPMMMWNPPWTLSLIMPYAAVDYPFGRILWFLSQTALICFCASFIWRFYKGPQTLIWVSWLVAFSFLPTLTLLRAGQIGAVMLFGAVLLLMLSQRPTWWLAGLFMLFISVKPHILYLVVLAFLFWAIQHRRWDLLLGSGTGILLATGIALLFNPMVLKQYLYAITHQPPPLKEWATPTIGGTLRYFWRLDLVWLQYVPTVLGMVWFCFYWIKKRLTWNWPEQLPLLVAISVVTSSYCWVFDYVVLILVILPVAAALLLRGLDRTTLLALGLYVVIAGLALVPVLGKGIRYDFWFMWLAPALAGWYLLMIKLGVVRLSPGAG